MSTLAISSHALLNLSHIFAALAILVLLAGMAVIGRVIYLILKAPGNSADSKSHSASHEKHSIEN